MVGTETDKIERVINLSEIRSGVARNDERLGELHTRVTRIDEQLDRMEGLLTRLVAVMEAKEKRASQSIEARADMFGKAIGLLRNPALWAAVGAGGISLGGNQMCNASQAHNAPQMAAPALVAPPSDPRPQPAPEPPDTGQ